MLRAPPGTAASMVRRCSSVSATSVTISGCKRSQPGSIRLAGICGCGVCAVFWRCTSRAKSASRGCSKIARAGMGQPWRRSFSISWMAISECPPSSKK
ncbi:hypothetical protein ACAN107058_22990 [Paracidovorax anthurii]